MPDDPKDDSFAALFEQSGKTAPRARRPRPGDVVQATIVQVGKEAVFVELEGRQQAFIETTELHDAEGKTSVAVGDRLEARVVRVDDEGIRLTPTMRAAVAAGATVELRAAAGVEPAGAKPETVRVAVGQVVHGVVDRVESYGVFVQLDGTKGRAGRGLVPTSELGVPRGADLRKHFPIGTKLKTKIVALDEGKMRLSITALKDDEERAEVEAFRGKEQQDARGGFGTLGDLLKRGRGK
ncbi:MAG TPA: S1 RNA-binding domain-containing protein [Polyangiaceae bacterium]